MTPQELKIVFTGPMGAGKTTAIGAISDAPPVSTEVRNTDRQAHSKEFTTVALDFGQMLLEDGTAVRLYGTPGQQRFSFMWEILCRGAIGVILLIDATSATATEDLHSFVETFQRFTPDQPLVIGVGRVPQGESEPLERFERVLASEGVLAPVFGVDVRKRDDVLLLVETLLCILETRIEEPTDDA
jgi:signal recognition particle receptor subunit beta